MIKAIVGGATEYYDIISYLELTGAVATVVLLGTFLTANLIPTEESGNVCLIAVFGINFLMMIPYSSFEVIVCVLNIIMAIIPILMKISKLRIVYSTWNLLPDGKAECNNCKYVIDFKSNPQFICPKCKADMRKPPK